MDKQTLVTESSGQASSPECRCNEEHVFASPSLTESRPTMLLGLPCARCKAYFAANLAACPICGCKEKERVPLVKM